MYTTGFIPAYGTNPGNTPYPLEFSWAKESSGIDILARDILALTRLDWNNTDFSTYKSCHNICV